MFYKFAQTYAKNFNLVERCALALGTTAMAGTASVVTGLSTGMMSADTFPTKATTEISSFMMGMFVPFAGIIVPELGIPIGLALLSKDLRNK